MVLDGARVRSASWVFGAAREPLPIDEADLLQTDPPRRLRLDSEGDDIAALAGVVRLVTPGRYTLRWRVGYSIAGQPNELVSEPFHLVHDE